MPIALRPDFDAADLRLLAKKTKDAGQARRLLALAAIYEVASRTAAAEIGSVTLQIVRDWVLKFNADGPIGLIDRKPPGQPPFLNDTHRAALKAMLERGPIPAVHGVVRWRIVDLCQWMWEEFRISIENWLKICVWLSGVRTKVNSLLSPSDVKLFRSSVASCSGAQ